MFKALGDFVRKMRGAALLALAVGSGGARAAESEGARTRPLGEGEEIYTPKGLHPDRGGAYDVIYHFNVGQKAARAARNLERSGLNAAIVTVNLWPTNKVRTYRDAFRDAAAFRGLMDRTALSLGGPVGRVALSSWSAGSAAVKELLGQEGVADRVDAVFLADGLYARPARGGGPRRDELRTVALFAARAGAGEKLLSVTHSNLRNGDNPITTAVTARVLLDLAGVAGRAEGSGRGPGGLRQLYTAGRGGFTVSGYAGTHAAHVENMDTLHYSGLAGKWEMLAP